MRELTCLVCNKDLSKRCTKYCSANCYYISKKNSTRCLFCSKIINSNLKRRKYCSRKCSANSKRKQVVQACYRCKKEFTFVPWQRKNSKKIFCSKSCKQLKSKVKTSCYKCNKDLEIYLSRYKYYSKFYCSNNCRTANLENQFLTTDKVNSNSNYQQLVRSLRATAKYLLWKKQCLERDQFKCITCNRDTSLTVHHLEEMFSICKRLAFNKNKIMSDSIFNNIDNGITLCRSCHLKVHQKRECNEV